MPVNMTAFGNGQQLYQQALNNQRQAKIDAQADEKFGWERERQERESAARTETQRLAGELRPMFEDEPANPYGAPAQAPGAPLGHEAQDAAAANPAEVNALQSPAANPAENNLASGLQKGMQQLAQQRKMIRHAYDLAVANNDRQGMLGAMEAVRSLNRTQEDAQIFQSVYSNPQTVQGLAQNLTRNPAIPLKASTDARGITTLVRDDGSQAGTLSPEQMAMAAVFMRRIERGDVEAGYKGLQSISAELAAAVTAGNKQVAELATSGNDALKLGAELDYKQAQAATLGAQGRYYDGARAEQARASAEAARARAAKATPAATLQGQSLQLLEQSVKDAPSDTRPSPQHYAAATGYVQDFARGNPRADAASVTHHALRAATDPQYLASRPLVIDIDNAAVVRSSGDEGGGSFGQPMRLGQVDTQSLLKAQRQSLQEQLPQVADALGLRDGVQTLRAAARDPARAKQVLDAWMVGRERLLDERIANTVGPDGQPASMSASQRSQLLARERQRGERLIGLSRTLLQ